ncbi:MAG: PEGA domain-containing protein, partial [Myxococcales bacterium]|nr:PEGA domain-containing protein [Myxococcales bacterium]
MLIALLAPASSAELQIEVSPKNARIELDGKAVDGFTDLKVIAGNHKLVVTASGYDTETRTISLKPGTKRTEKVALNKSAASKPPVAKKPVESSPPVAKKPPTTRKPVARKPTTRKPVSKRPPARKPVSKRPPARKPVSKRPPARKPVTTKPVTKRPPKSR